jgi:hypothetical protein
MSDQIKLAAGLDSNKALKRTVLVSVSNVLVVITLTVIKRS